MPPDVFQCQNNSREGYCLHALLVGFLKASGWPYVKKKCWIRERDGLMYIPKFCLLVGSVWKGDLHIYLNSYSAFKQSIHLVNTHRRINSLYIWIGFKTLHVFRRITATTLQTRTCLSGKHLAMLTTCQFLEVGCIVPQYKFRCNNLVHARNIPIWQSLI